MNSKTNSKLQEETAWYFALVLLGAGINVAIILPIAAQAVNAIAGINPVPFYGAVLLYGVVGVVYSTAASLAFKPKRFVSPITIQMLAVPILGILFVDYVLRLVTPPALGSILSSSLILLYVLIAMILYLIGRLQQRIVLYFVGLRGTKEDTIRDLWLLEGKLDDVLAVMSQKELRYALDISPAEELRKNIFLFSTGALEEQKLFLVLRGPVKGENLSELGSVAYEVSGSGTENSSNAKDVTKMRLDHLKDALVKKGIKTQEVGSSSETSEALQVAYEYAMRPTDSHILGFAKLPRAHKIGALGLTLIFILVSGAWLYGTLSTENYEVALILLGIALFTEFLLNLRSRASKALRLIED